jgi:hypothetical protein
VDHEERDFRTERLNGRDYWGDLSIDGRITLKLTEEQDLTVWSTLIELRIVFTGGLTFLTTVKNLRVAYQFLDQLEQLLTGQEVPALRIGNSCDPPYRRFIQCSEAAWCAALYGRDKQFPAR